MRRFTPFFVSIVLTGVLPPVLAAYTIEDDFAIIEVDPSPATGDATSRLYEADTVEPQTWDWNNAGFLGWEANGFDDLEVSSGGIRGTASIPAPFLEVIHLDGPDLDFGFFNFLQTRLKLPSDFTGDVIFRFGTSTRRGNTSLAREFRIPNHLLNGAGEWQTYRIDLGLIVWWRDQLTDLRVYPVGDDGGGLSFEVDYLEIGDKPGDELLVNTDLGLASGESLADASRMESKHFVFWWSPASYDVDSRLNPQVHGRRALRMAEESHQVFHKILGYREPFESWDLWRRDGNRYKVNHTTWHGGFWMGGRNGFGWLNVPAGGLLDENWGNPVPHEVAHVVQAHQINHLVGGHWESHANYLRQAWQMHHAARFPANQRAQLSLFMLVNSNYRQDHGRLIYHDFRIHNALEAVAMESGADLDSDLPARLWYLGQRDATVYDTLAAILPAGHSVQDVVARGLRRWPFLDFEQGHHFRGQLWNTNQNRAWHNYLTGSLLIPSHDRPGWWRVPTARAPERYGYMYHELDAESSSVTIELQGLPVPGDREDWRWSLAAVNDDGDIRYHGPFPPGTETVSLEPDESKVYLIVVATPTDTALNLEWSANRLPLDRHPDRLRYPYEVRIEGARPAPRQLDWNTAAGSPHGNGGGWVANSASVSPSAWVGPNARVLGSATVSGSARIEDYAVVAEQARVEANAVVSGYAVVRGSAIVRGQARVRDRGVVRDSVQVNDNAVVTEYALLEGNVRLHNDALARGQTSPLGGVITGDAILDYDYAMGESLSDGVHYSHVPWGDWYVDYWVRTQAKPRGLIASYRMEASEGSLLLDEFGSAHGLLRGNAQRIGASDRNTRVLRLDGESGYAVLDRNVASLRASTFSLWVNPAAENAENPVLYFGGAPDRYLQIIPRDGEGRARLKISDGTSATEYVSQTATPVGQWTHLAFSIDAGRQATWYVNGQIEDSGMAVAFPEQVLGSGDYLNAEALYLGRGWDGALFSGDVSDLRIYHVALTQGEVDAERMRSGNRMGAFFVTQAGDFSDSEFQSGIRDGVVRTLEARIFPRTPGSGTYYSAIFDSSDERTATLRGSGFGLRNQRLFVRLATVGFWDTGVDVELNAWQTIVLTYNGRQAVLYLDGQEVAARNYTAGEADVAGKNFRIGFAQSAASGNPRYYFDGEIMNAFIYDRVVPPVSEPLIEEWRITHFGSPGNAGLAADEADFDGDGFANLIEYALGANPTVPGDAASRLAMGTSRPPLEETFGDDFQYARDFVAEGLEGTGWDRITGIAGASAATIEARNGVLYMTSSGTYGDAYPVSIARSVPADADLQATVRLVSAPSSGSTFDRDYVNFTAPMLYVGRSDNTSGVSHYVAHHFFEAFGHGNGMQVVQNFARTHDGSFTPSPGHPWLRIEFQHATGTVVALRSQDGETWQEFGSQTLPALIAASAELEIGLIHTVWGNANPDAAWVEWDNFEIRNLSVEPGESEKEYLWLQFEHIGDPDLVYVVEASDDLGEGWYPVRTFGPFFLPGSQTYFDEEPIGAGSSRFIRLSVHRSE